MASADLQAFLRFLAKDAKVPLALAIAKFPQLKSQHLDSIQGISKADVKDLTLIFLDDKVAKQVRAAARRQSKKRDSGDDISSTSCDTKRKRADPFESPSSIPPHVFEQSLCSPESGETDEQLAKHVFLTNRAPFLLAFAVTLLKYTMPEQPVSSRWSLAQAVVSEGARYKARTLGLATGPTANDEGWAQGQPVVTIMTRQVSVLKRWGYNWRSEANLESNKLDHTSLVANEQDSSTEPALWSIDLEKLKKMNGPLTFSSERSDATGLPVYSPDAARDYVLRSFACPDSPDGVPIKKKTTAVLAAERKQNAGRLLHALDLVYSSWAPHLSTSELDKRAWSWYVAVRPDVEQGLAGWGAKGQVRLVDVLNLRRT